jgi:outer membrane protein OmpA-like peptidoglycan-associated protein
MNVRKLIPYVGSIGVLCFCASLRAQTQLGQTIEIPPSVKSTRESITFERINLGPNVNSQYSELFPVLTPDETIMYFVRKGDPQNTGYAKNHNDEDIWYSMRQADGSWSQSQKLQGPLNTANYDGVRAINNSASHLYLQNIYNPDGTGSKGFSVSEKQPDGSWAFPKPLDIKDYYNDTSTAMMTVSNDEQTIIFSIQRKDGMGQHDFYLSHNLGGYKWSRPELIGELSTPGDDIAPFIAYDDRTLYFSTNGRGGYGGYDIFITRRLDSTWQHWSLPKNLGEPINTPSFDAYFTLGARGDTAYFSSSHESSIHGFGKSDIWKIGLKREQRPGFQLPSGSAWNPNVTEQYLKGSVFRLDDVLFEVGKSHISALSKPALDKIAEVMKRLPGLRLEVQGHTDSDGDPDNNLRLSQQRAESVCQYLEEQGIATDRLVAKGYGETHPIAPNDSQQGKALNRRVMIEVLN